LSRFLNAERAVGGHPAVLIQSRRAIRLFQTLDHGAIRDTHLQAAAGLQVFRTEVALFNSGSRICDVHP